MKTKNKRIVLQGAIAVSLLAPMAMFAATVRDLPELITYIITLINSVIPVIFGIAVLTFLWGVMKYVIASDVKSKAEGRVFIVYGIIGLAVMLSVWGLAFFVRNTFFEGSPNSLIGSGSADDGTLDCRDPSNLGC